MKINQVEIYNFYSAKDMSITFDDYEGIVLIEGQNKDTGGSNGAGKSIIIESVVWGLFGQTVRKSTEEALVNNQAKKKCLVRLRVNDNIVIERGKRPTTLHVYQDGVDITRANQRETQAMLDELLGINYKVFLSSSVFGQQNNLEFLAASPDDKRIILKNFLNLDQLFDLRESVKFLKSQYTQRTKSIDAIIEEHNKNIQSFEKEIAESEIIASKILSKYSEEILDLSFEQIANIEKHNTDIDWKVANVKRSIEKVDSNIDALKRKRQSANDKNCYTCGQPVKGKKVDIDSINMEITDLVGKRYDLELQLTELPLSKKDLPISSYEFGKIAEYKQLRKEQETFKEIKKHTLEKIDTLIQEKTTLNRRYEVMRFWEKAFSEQGLVKYIIRNVLTYLNSKANYYLSHLSQGKFFIEFDQELNETITHRGEVVNYISLSGGERRKVGLAVMLGLQSLLNISSNSESNLLFFDEVAENLDQDGLDGLYILLSDLKKSKTLFVITHNNYLKSLMDNSKTLTIMKRKGVSTVKGK